MNGTRRQLSYQRHSAVVPPIFIYSPISLIYVAGHRLQPLPHLAQHPFHLVAYVAAVHHVVVI